MAENRPSRIVVRQSPFRPDPNWSIDKIREVLTEHECGTFYRSARMAQWMRRDERYRTCAMVRAMSVLGLPFVVAPPVDNPRLKEKQAAKRINAVAREIMPEKVAHEILGDILDLGFCLCQLHWTDKGPGSDVRWVPRLVRWDPQFVQYDAFARVWKIQTYDAGQLSITPGDGQWVLFSDRDTNPWLSGAVLGLADKVLLRSNSWIDWGNISDGAGQTFLKLYIPAWALKDEQDTETGTPSKTEFLTAGTALMGNRVLSNEGPITSFVSQVDMLQNHGYRALGCELGSQGLTNGFDAKYESADASGFIAPKELQERANIAITTRILGQTTSVEVKQGAPTAPTDQASVRQDIIEADAEFLATDLRGQVLSWVALYNFGDVELAPWAFYDPTPPEDAGAMAATAKTTGDSIATLDAALAADGMELDKPALFARIGLPLRKKIEAAMAPGVETPKPKKSKKSPRNAQRNTVPFRRMGQRPKTQGTHE